MTKEKWLEIYEQSYDKTCSDYDIDPKLWHLYKPILLNFIKEVDEATEVYNQENGVDNGTT